MTILFLCAAPVHKMHFTDMYINTVGKEYETILWDISILNGEKNHTNPDYPDVPVIQTAEELSQRVRKLCNGREKVVAITNLLIFGLHKIYSVLHENGIPVIQIDKEAMIFWMQDQYLREHPEEATEAERKKLKWTSNPLTAKGYHYLSYQHVKFDYMLGARNYFPDASRHFIHIHNLKYDEAMQSMHQEKVLDYPYILFMDAGLAHLPSFSGKANSIDREEYLDVMNRFFDRIEEKMHLPVVIAAHPKSEYPADPFHGRPVILYKTPQLARYAELVLAHYSTSLIDLVLQKKPIIFLYSRDYMHCTPRTVLMTECEYAKLLEAPLFDLKHDTEIVESFHEEAYDRFIREHIVNEEKKDQTNAELVCEFLASLER